MDRVDAGSVSVTSTSCGASHGTDRKTASTSVPHVPTGGGAGAGARVADPAIDAPHSPGPAPTKSAATISAATEPTRLPMAPMLGRERLSRRTVRSGGGFQGRICDMDSQRPTTEPTPADPEHSVDVNATLASLAHE